MEILEALESLMVVVSYVTVATVNIPFGFICFCMFLYVYYIDIHFSVYDFESLSSYSSEDFQTYFGKSEGIESTPGIRKPDCAIDSAHSHCWFYYFS